MAIPRTMKAAVVKKSGEPLVVQEVPVPSPGPGQVLVEIIAGGVCHTDLHAADGDWPVKPTVPLENLEMPEREPFVLLSYTLLARSFFSRHSSPLCVLSSARALPSNSRSWLCAIKSACFSGRRQNGRN